MSLSPSSLLLDGIKALAITLTGLAPSAELGSQCSSYSASLLSVIFVTQPITVLILVCLSCYRRQTNPCHFLHRYLSPHSDIHWVWLSLFSFSVLPPQLMHTAYTQIHNVSASSLFFYLLLSSVYFPLLWQVQLIQRTGLALAPW